MTEYALNKLDIMQLVELACSTGTFLAVFETPTFKIELYHTGGHFVEISYSLKKSSEWRVYAANHFPDGPGSTKYLSLYLDQIELTGH